VSYFQIKDYKIKSFDYRTTETEDMEKKYQRVVTSSLLGLRKLLTSLPVTEIESITELLSDLLSDNKFWKHGKSATISVSIISVRSVI